MYNLKNKNKIQTHIFLLFIQRSIKFSNDNSNQYIF